MASKIQIDRGDHRDSEAVVVSGRKVRGSGTVNQLVGLVQFMLLIRSSYVSKLSRPDGSYADTFCVCKSEIFPRILSIVDCFNMFC